MFSHRSYALILYHIYTYLLRFFFSSIRRRLHNAKISHIDSIITRKISCILTVSPVPGASFLAAFLLPDVASDFLLSGVVSDFFPPSDAFSLIVNSTV